MAQHRLNQPFSDQPSVAILFSTFGPYHRARLRAAASTLKVTGLELETNSAEYAWAQGEELKEAEIHSLYKGHACTQTRSIGRHAMAALERIQPDVVAIPGWSGPFALSALHWCILRKRPAILMSESQSIDKSRSSWKELLKCRLVGACSAGFVGGTPQKEYLIQLGVPSDQVFLGYDAVDNGYFEREVKRHQRNQAEIRAKLGVKKRYFLASARFVPKKNLHGLVEAYSIYRSKCDTPWDLVVLGDGPLRESLFSLRNSLKLEHSVHFPGFQQYSVLPEYYAFASVFIHASTVEQWGLVINEAMASGLPILASRCCGCARDLVGDGVNGFCFDPNDCEEMAGLMMRVSAYEFPLVRFADASRKIIFNWGADRFRHGLELAVQCALRQKSKRCSLVTHLLLNILKRH